MQILTSLLVLSATLTGVLSSTTIQIHVGDACHADDQPGNLIVEDGVCYALTAGCNEYALSDGCGSGPFSARRSADFEILEDGSVEYRQYAAEDCSGSARFDHTLELGTCYDESDGLRGKVTFIGLSGGVEEPEVPEESSEAQSSALPSDDAEQTEDTDETSELVDESEAVQESSGPVEEEDSTDVMDESSDVEDDTSTESATSTTLTTTTITTSATDTTTSTDDPDGRVCPEEEPDCNGANMSSVSAMMSVAVMVVATVAQW